MHDSANHNGLGRYRLGGGSEGIGLPQRRNGSHRFKCFFGSQPRLSARNDRYRCGKLLITVSPARALAKFVYRWVLLQLKQISTLMFVPRWGFAVYRTVNISD